MTDIIIKRGTVGIVTFTGHLTIGIDIMSNAEQMTVVPTFRSIVDESLETLLLAEPDMLTFKIDCTDCIEDFRIFRVTNGDKLVRARLSRNLPGANKNVRAVDLEMVKDAIDIAQTYLPSVASQNAGFDIIYYPTEALAGIDVISSVTLKSITEAKQVTAVYPSGAIYENIDFDQFGLKYEQLTKLHIVQSDWRDAGLKDHPVVRDILYMPIVDMYFSVTDVTALQSVSGKTIAYELTLSIVTDSENVTADDDLLDLSDLIDPLPDDSMTPEHSELTNRPYHKYGLLALTKTETVDVSGQTKWMYGIVWADAWLKFRAHGTSQEFFSLNGLPVSVEPSMTLEVAKLVIVNQPLSSMHENMYWTSYELPTDKSIKPLKLINHVERA